MRKISNILCWIGVAASLFILTPSGFCQVKYPKYENYVTDKAGVLTSADELQLNSFLGELEKLTTAQIAVLTVKTTNGLSVEEYAVGVFEQWQIGRKDKDNGVLLLAAIKDRKVRIEVGYGLEGEITDAQASGIIREVIVPQFKREDYAGGLTGAIKIISGIISKKYGVSLSESVKLPGGAVKEDKKASPLDMLFTLLFIILIVSSRMGLFGLLFFGSAFRRRGGYWHGTGYGGSSGGFSGGFGGFGGGFSGGGGASGSW
ncbi:MAG: TPM domain-containing protein [Candidatus Omnitrophica bacterium]|nr:TPM domain-containing protein [Candidatus Omnitrophota bacterium]